VLGERAASVTSVVAFYFHCHLCLPAAPSLTFLDDFEVFDDGGSTAVVSGFTGPS